MSDNNASVTAVRFEHIAKQLETIIALQNLTNGRVRKNEIAIAVLQWAYAVGAAVMAAWFFDIVKH